MGVLLFVIVYTIVSIVLSQPQCDLILPNSSELNDIVEELVQLSYDDATTSIVESTIQYTCLAQGETQGMYRAASVIASYYRNDLAEVGQFQFHCLNNHWMPILDEGIVAPPVNYSLLEPNHSCYNCSRFGNNDHNCIRCNSACVVGLQKCTGPAEEDCCSFFQDGSCITQCKLDYEANDTFICGCNFPCGQGYMPNDRCDGCTITSICFTDNPCLNGGSCIVGENSATDYTCNCTDGWTGTKCTVCGNRKGRNNGTCVSCSDSNCIECSHFFQNCTQCEEGYSIGTQGQCISNKLQNLTVVWIVLGSVLGGLSLLSIAFTIVMTVIHLKDSKPTRRHIRPEIAMKRTKKGRLRAFRKSTNLIKSNPLYFSHDVLQNVNTEPVQLY